MLFCIHFLCSKSSTDEQYTAKDQLLTEALALFEDAARRKKVDAGQKAGSAEAKKRTEAIQTRDDAVKTLGQKRT